jgi:hypothetical protein
MKPVLVAIIVASVALMLGDVNPSANGCAQSGTWTVQPGNTPNTTAWLTQFPASSSSVITTATTTTVKSTAGTLRRVIVGTGVAAATVKLFNVAGASCTSTPGSGALGVLTIPATVSNPFFIDYMQTFSAGICVVTSGATNVTVIFD